MSDDIWLAVIVDDEVWECPVTWLSCGNVYLYANMGRLISLRTVERVRSVSQSVRTHPASSLSRTWYDAYSSERFTLAAIKWINKKIYIYIVTMATSRKNINWWFAEIKNLCRCDHSFSDVQPGAIGFCDITKYLVNNRDIFPIVLWYISHISYLLWLWSHSPNSHYSNLYFFEKEKGTWRMLKTIWLRKPLML